MTMQIYNKKPVAGRLQKAGLRRRMTNSAAKALANKIDIPRVADIKSQASKASRALTSKNISAQPIDRYRAEAKALCLVPMLGSIGDQKCRHPEPTDHYAERIAKVVERAETREE